MRSTVRIVMSRLTTIFQKRKKLTTTIIVHCTDKCWVAHFHELGVDLPLSFTPETKFYVVSDDLKQRYPEAIIVFDKIEIDPKECVCILYDRSSLKEA